MKIIWMTAMLAVGATTVQAQVVPPRRERPATPAPPGVTVPRAPEAPRSETPLLLLVEPALPALMDTPLPMLAPLPGDLPMAMDVPLPDIGPLMLLAEEVPVALEALTPLPSVAPLMSLSAEPLTMLIESPVVPFAPLPPMALEPGLPITELLFLQGSRAPRPARVDTIRDREEARRLAEIAREQAALQRDLQLQLSREQNELQRLQAREMAEIARQDAELQRQLQLDLSREEQEIQRSMARDQAEQARANAEIARAQAMDHARAVETFTHSFSQSFHAPSFSVRAPAPWAGQDVGDSVYRAARELLNRGEWGQAAAYFRGLPQRFPNSAYAAEAGYYQAFALYRIGGTAELREALSALEAQRTKYPNARSRSEAATLATRIRGVLAERGDAQARTELAAQTATQGATCDKEEQAVQAAAMNALSRSDAANVNDLINRVLARRDECAVPLRKTAVLLVGNRRDAQAVTILAGVARNDPSVEVRVEAVNVIGRLPSEEGVPVLEEMARADDERVQRAAIRALVRHPSARARQSVRALVERDDVSERMRSDALSAFNADRATADDITWLRSLYAKFQSPTLKSRTLSAIVRVGGPDVDQWLVTIASNENERSDLRATAMRRIGASMSIADLGRLYDGATQQRFRQEIISVLGKRTEDAATDKLIQIVKGGTDPSLRRSAISALANKNDPRATQLLLEIINK